MTPEQLRIRQFAVKELLLFLLVVTIFVLLGSALAVGLASMLGIEDMQVLLGDISADTPKETLESVQLILMVSQLFTFLLPGVVFAVLYYRKNWLKRTLLSRAPSTDNISWGFGLLMLTFVAMQLVYWLNKQIPLPDSLKAAEDTSQALIQAMITLDSPMALPMNLLVMALLPAIGEELIFRGLLQRIAVRLTANVHAGIWISATLFSLMHWQFEGFFVRQLLGALFGYLLYWSGSLWLPILVHFVFNGLQIVGQYMYVQGKIDVDLDQEIEMTSGNLIMGAVALILTLILCSYVHRKRKPERLEYERAMGENL